MLGIRWLYILYIVYIGELRLDKDGCLLFFAAASTWGFECAVALIAKPFAAEPAADPGRV